MGYWGRHERVYGVFQDFHAYFAALFGRRETRDHSRHYLQDLLVQSGERRNAENLSETVPASARAMQRFLTESPWDDDTVIGRLQEYVAPRLGHPEVAELLRRAQEVDEEEDSRYGQNRRYWMNGAWTTGSICLPKMLCTWSRPPTCRKGAPNATWCSSTMTSPACALRRRGRSAVMLTASIRGRGLADSSPTCELRKPTIVNSRSRQTSWSIGSAAAREPLTSAVSAT